MQESRDFIIVISNKTVSLSDGLDGFLIDPVSQHQLLVDCPIGVEDDDHVLASHLSCLLLHLHSLLGIVDCTSFNITLSDQSHI